MRLMARLRRAAMIWGPLRVRSWWRSSSKTTSRIQWRRFSMAQCPRAQEATSSGGASVGGREQIRWATSVVVLLPPPRLLTVLVRRIRITWAAPGKSIHAGASTAWTVRRTLRPWEPSGTEVEGTSFQGSFLRARFRPGWLFLTVST
ncbi:hypothetical protein AM609_06820 [Actinomyces sp. oral taxon 414]|nr:hypothetical protein AM609_06820 [Actinomyces sp. oral taxon 414]